MLSLPAGCGVIDPGDLWRQRARKEVREALVTRYRHLVTITVRRFRKQIPARVESGDLESAGFLGLLQAINDYEPERGLQFETLAVHKIRGRILDHLRGEDRRTRQEKNRMRAVEATAQTLEREGVRPTPEAIAHRMGLSLEEVLLILEGFPPPLSIEQHAEQEEPLPSPEEGAAPFDRALVRVQQEALVQAVGALPRREQQVVMLYYYEHRTCHEIALRLGVSDARAYQILRRALARLAEHLAETRSLFTGEEEDDAT